MRRSNSFPSAALDEIASAKLTSRLTAQLVSPPVPSGPDSSASSDDLDSDTFAEDWAVTDDASTPTRCVSVYLHRGTCTPCNISQLQVTHSVMKCIISLMYATA